MSDDDYSMDVDEDEDEYDVEEEDEDIDDAAYESDNDDLLSAIISSKNLDEATLELLQEDVQMARVQLEDPELIRLTPLGPKFTLPIVDMHPATRQACGLLKPDPLYVFLDLSKGYKRSSPFPTISVTYGASNLSTSSERPNGRFGLGIQLTNAIQKHLQVAWKSRGDNFLFDLYRLMEDRLVNCGNLCMLCDRPLPFPGLKPTICDDKFCSYQLEKLGIGAGLHLIDTDPLVADFLICAALAAASSGGRLPFALPTMPTVLSQEMREDQPIPPGKIVGALNYMPKLGTLPKDEDARTAALKAADPLLEPILRWIFATNRAHIVSLEPNEMFPEMRTEFQFKINTSTRAHASAFEAMKARHGSFFAFHGSSTANWHNILRNNLKNASNTAMMSAGAAYGPGIYLATQSSLSMGYTRTGVACQGRFFNSVFEAHPRILALCEVANAPQVQRHHRSGIIVASEETCVALRYLFIYTGYENPNVDAGSLKLQQYRNDTTIIGMTPVSEIEPSLLLVTSDDYAWDIEELVQLIESKHGVFINGYTRLGFTPVDVQKIINHASGRGQRLRTLELKNAELRRMIPAEVYRNLNAVGAICVAEQNEDYNASTQAILELKVYIESLPRAVKDALERAPFEAVDRNSRLPFRDTVMHEIELVTSAGDCVHRFGDFLSQIKPS